jgi:hypothetical protein
MDQQSGASTRMKNMVLRASTMRMYLRHLVAKKPVDLSHLLGKIPTKARDFQYKG